MDLKTWREKREETVTLPSGLEARLRKVDLVGLMVGGSIPNSLLPEFMAMTEGPVEMDVEKLPTLAPIFDAVVLAAVIEPPVAETGDDEHLGLDEIPFEDKMFIFERCSAEAARLKPFRENSAGERDAVEAV